MTMKIKQVHAHFLVSTGNYGNERIGFTVELSDDDNLEQVVEELRNKAIELIGKDAETQYQYRRKLQFEVNKLDRQLEEARQEYQKVSEFFEAQGIKTMPDIHTISRLLTPSPTLPESELVRELEGEDDSDYLETDF